MIIIALDPSSTHIGYCLAEDGTYILSGVFAPKGNPDARVRKIVAWIKHKLRTFEPNCIVLEEPAANNSHANAKTDRLLARVGGALEAMALDQGVEVFRVWPSQVKATGCSKDTLPVASSVAGKDSVGPDEADAIGVWLAWLAKENR